MAGKLAASGRIGVVSDTHGNAANTQRAVELLAESDVQQVIHCGDIGSPAIPPMFALWPTHFVFGNVDQQTGDLKRAIEEAGHVCHGQFGHIEVCGTTVAFLHGHDVRRLNSELNNGRWALVCSGHTHRREQRYVANTLALNPGAVHRAKPHTAAIVELPSLRVQWLEF